jgi:hypothetical protein
MPKILLLVLLTTVVVMNGNADQKIAQTPDTRHHFEVFDEEQDNVVYDVTEIIKSSEQSSESNVLVRDAGLGEFVIQRIRSFKEQTITYRINDVKNRTFIEASAKMPFAAKTRQETLQEGRQTNLGDLPAIVTIETNGGRWDSVESEWEDRAALRQFRHRLRQSVDSFLLEAIERMRGTPLTSVVDTFYSLIGQLVIYGPPGGDAAVPPFVKVREVDPDCAFDAHFGFPCSAKQLERVTKAAKTGKTLPQY